MDGVPDTLDLCSRTPLYARIQINGPYLGCAAGQVIDCPGAGIGH
jgi:hypothetical protein